MLSFIAPADNYGIPRSPLCYCLLERRRMGAGGKVRKIGRGG